LIIVHISSSSQHELLSTVVLEPLLIILIYSGSKTVTDGGFEPLQLTFSVVVAGSKLFYSKIEKFAYTMIMWSINTSRKMIYGNIHVFYGTGKKFQPT
jgi:hypothetical protein